MTGYRFEVHTQQDVVTIQFLHLTPLRQSLINLALTRERFDVSDRAGAAIASAVFKDFGVIGDDNLAEVIESTVSFPKLSSPIT